MKSGWVIIQSGRHQGRLHLAGWLETAIHAAPNERYASGPVKGEPRLYHGVAHCPVCFAMVSSDESTPYGDLTWAHERWHHESGTFPVPPELLENGRW